MEEVTEFVEVNGWRLTRVDGASVSGSARLKAAESLSRFAEAEKFRSAAMLHDEAQHAVDPRLEAREDRRGMQVSLRTGRIMSYAATQSAVMEIALVMGLSQGQGQRVLDQAETLVMDTPEVLESLALGRVGASHVQRILEHTQHLVPECPPLPARDADEATREAWEREVAARAATSRAERRDFGADMLAIAPGKSPSQLRTRGRQVLEKYYGQSFTKRSRTALRDRRITLEPAQDGMTWFSGFLPTASCQAIFSKIDAMARLLKADPDSAAAVTRAAAQAAQAAHEPAADGAADGTTEGAVEGAVADPEPDPAETRTMDQLRSDVFVDVMLNGPRGQGLETVNAEVFVAIPATMLPGTPGGPTTQDTTTADGTGNQDPTTTGTTTGSATGSAAGDGAGDGAGAGSVASAVLPPGAPVPALLEGGVIDQGSAAQLMNAAKTWWRLITDPLTGAIITFGQDRYRPSPAQRAALRFRDGGCTTPGCTAPARTCEVDHTTEWQDGGGTDIANLQNRCKRCHRLKSLGLIDVEQRAGGTILVTSLFGTRKTFHPAAPWTTPATTTETTGQNPLPAGPKPPPPDPDAVIPTIEPTYYLPPRTGQIDPYQDPEDEDPGMSEAEYHEWTARMLREGDPQAADHLAERAAENATAQEFADAAEREEHQHQDLAPDPPPRPYDPADEKPESEHYQQMQIQEWSQVQDVPDPSVENPEHGRYARSKNGKATRKRRLKRNNGEYGPCARQVRETVS